MGGAAALLLGSPTRAPREPGPRPVGERRRGAARGVGAAWFQRLGRRRYEYDTSGDPSACVAARTARRGVVAPPGVIAENARSTVLPPFVTSLLTITSVGGPKAPYLPSVARIFDASACGPGCPSMACRYAESPVFARASTS